jgi:hypothetical protein
MEDDRVWAVKQILFDYLKSPSLRHMRDPHSVGRLAQEIVKRLDRGNTIWRKWDSQRETLLKSATACWVPVEDLRDYLNGMPGPKLTTTDVAERLRLVEEAQYETPTDDLRASCRELYDLEKTEGTELPAIISRLKDHVTDGEVRLRTERQDQYKKMREEQRAAQEQRLLSGADCNWTQLRNSKNWYCRKNGRTYRVSPTKDNMWRLDRVAAAADEEPGGLIGKYRGRGDATKALADLAYKPEPKW